MALSLEDKFDEVRQLLVIGKEKGYLLYDEVNDLLPADLTASPEDLEELLAVRKEIFGDSDLRTVEAMIEMGKLFRDMEDYGAALPYYEQAMAIVERTLAENDATTIRILNLRAMALEKLGRTEEAAVARERIEKLKGKQ